VTDRAQWTLVGAIVLGLAGSAAFAAREWGAEMRTVSVGDAMPDFDAHTMSEPAVTKWFRDYRGKVVIVNVWATWCLPCREEMPSLERLYKEFGPQGLVVLGVATDNPGQERAIRDFAARYGLSFDVLQEGTGRVEQMLQAPGIPTTIVVGRDGIIRKKVIGASAWDSPANRALVARLLAP
jgi:cytochrome c biogenesis protein CcmG, thiol:disulfide interchange protein DsbE